MELIQSNPTLQKNPASKLHKERKLTSRTYVADIFAGSQWTVRRMSNPAMRFWAWIPLPLPRKSGRPGRFLAWAVPRLFPDSSLQASLYISTYLTPKQSKTFEDNCSQSFHFTFPPFPPYRPNTSPSCRDGQLPGLPQVGLSQAP